ncbi:DUF2809 domain-containing protein [Spirosoma sp.]|uniref:ribosomal maturation YjgA family protein n=1 Tax=Spirosoma sp. TaxID=1899569 RepID=UPI000A8F038E|nr:DUF2809 domain-containing protein [Spirosoma sp.]MBN8821555.1 DUF2809 domain-containing protein [Spirosoma sp.]
MRNRIIYGLLLISVIGFGLASRSFLSNISFIRNYAGDALWALMVFLGVGLLFRRWSTRMITLIALLFCVCIEISQLYHAPWIDYLRSTRLGGLVLGFGFLWSDLICYAFGIAAGAVTEFLLLSTSSRSDNPVQAAHP